MMTRAALTLLMAATFLFSCKKKGTDNTDVTFTNQVNQEVVLTIYPSMDDYSNATNATLRKVIGANDKLILPGSTFANGQTYYMDWHTNDLTINNWFNDNYPQPGTQVAIKPVAGNNSYYTNPAYKGISRITFLATDDKLSRWHAIDAYLYSLSTGYVSQWSSMSDLEKFRELTIHKNFTADYSYKNAPGNPTTDIIAFKVMPSQNAYLEFMDSKGKSSGSIVSGKLPTGTAPDYTVTTRDTVMAQFPNSEYYFMMVRDL